MEFTYKKIDNTNLYKKLDELGADPTGANGLIKINTREGSSSLDSDPNCNQFIETGRYKKVVVVGVDKILRRLTRSRLASASM